MKSIVALMVVAFLSANRFFSKLISVGPIYTAEIFILIAVANKFKSIYSLLLKNKFFIVFFLYFMFFLLYDAILNGVSEYSVRRSALFFYFVFPLIILVYRLEISNVFNKYFVVIPLLTVLVAALSPIGYQSSMASEFLGVLLVVAVFIKRKFKHIFITVLSFVVVVSGVLINESLFRTPVFVTFVIVILYLWFMKVESYNSYYTKYSLYMVIGLLFLISLFTGVLGNLIIGLSGLFDSEIIKSIGVGLGGELYTTRGTSSGTAETRLFFWTLIVEHAFSDIYILLFGNGFYDSFLDLLAPELLFREKELIEPHNSFVSIFYKTGMVGVFLTLLYIYKVFKIQQGCMISRKTSLPFIIGAFMFAGFEVALENPHGAILFWFILLAPLIFVRDGCR